MFAKRVLAVALFSSSRFEDSLTFSLPLTDAGAGIANITNTIGLGSPTYSRATSAWTKLSTGFWGSVASGQPRFCYILPDTSVQTDGGYFSEIQSTQLTTPTAAIRDMTDASWTKTNATAAKNATGIDGVANSATTLTATAGSASITQAFVGASTTRTYGVFIRRKTGTGTIRITNGATIKTVTSSINASTYTRVEVTSADVNPSFGILLTTSGDEIEVDFNQFEALSKATSPIDTAGATRNTDALTYPGIGNMSFSQGTCYAEISILNPEAQALVGTHTYVTTTSGSGLMLYLNNSGTNTGIRTDDGTNGVTKTGLTSMGTGMRKRAASWGSGGQHVTGDGVVPATATFDGDKGSGSIAIGPNGAGSSSIIRNVKISSRQLVDGPLSRLTA